MPLGGAIAGLGGAFLASNASKKATKDQVGIANRQMDLADKQFQQTRTDLSPYRQAGETAVGDLNDPNAFTTSPGYEFRLKQGMDGVAQNKAVNGLLNSGAALKALNDYNQNMASAEY